MDRLRGLKQKVQDIAAKIIPQGAGRGADSSEYEGVNMLGVVVGRRRCSQCEIILYYEMVNTVSNDALKWY